MKMGTVTYFGKWDKMGTVTYFVVDKGCFSS